MAKVLVAYADGSEDMEVTSVASILDRAGIQVVRAAIKTDSSTDVVLAHGSKIKCDANIDECNDTYDMIVIPGGLVGSKNCCANEVLVSKLKEQQKAGRYIGAICAAPGFVLEAHHLIGEAKATGYPGCCDNIKNYTGEPTTIDREHKIVTGKGPAFSIAFGLACVEVLVDAKTLEQVKAGMLY